MENRANKLDKNTLISKNEIEKGIPHFYADLNDIKELLANFKIELIKHTEYFYSDFNPDNQRREKFYYVNAILK
jgi:DNA-directed RNA polymerase delta subunit